MFKLIHCPDLVYHGSEVSVRARQRNCEEMAKQAAENCAWKCSKKTAKEIYGVDF